jgi:hypothetical protein
MYDLKRLATEIAKREKISFMTPKYIGGLTSRELFDFVQFYGHEKTIELLKPKTFFDSTSTLLLKLISEGKIDIKEIVKKEFLARSNKL